MISMFSSNAFLSHQSTTSNTCTNNNLEDKLNDIIFTPVLIERVLKKLKVKTKGGPDGVPPIFLKQCSALLCKPLAILFSSGFNFGYLPEDWLRSYITPIFKKGVPSDPNNYRTVALTATLCKVMESVIKDQLVQYLTSKGLISRKQHAFIKNHYLQLTYWSALMIGSFHSMHAILLILFILIFHERLTVLFSKSCYANLKVMASMANFLLGLRPS